MSGVEGREGQGGDGSPGGAALVTREIAAEAAIWIARLHGPGRSRHVERACLAWQARSPAHRLAFERCTDLWMDVAGVDRAAVALAAASAPEQGLPPGEPPKRAGEGTGWRLRPRALASALVATVALPTVLVLQSWRDIDTYATGLGEQRLVVLGDGSRMSLNTATRVKVELGPNQRRVSVEGGEAFFEVAKDANRPFVVQAAGTEVRATGTAFVVRLLPRAPGAVESLDVTLVEGQVVVREAGPRMPGAAPPVVMAAGERLRLSGSQTEQGWAASNAAPAQPQRDRPRLDQVLAWKRGEAVFDNASLPEALAEMNRYSTTPIVADPSLAALRISGLYRTGDNAGFARAVAALHGLTVREQPERLVLELR